MIIYEVVEADFPEYLSHGFYRHETTANAVKDKLTRQAADNDFPIRPEYLVRPIDVNEDEVVQEDSRS